MRKELDYNNISVSASHNYSNLTSKLLYLKLHPRSMNQKLAQITLVVNDYDEAIKFYTEKLHFTLIENTKLSETKRWVIVKPNGSGDGCLLLAKATNDEQKSRVGNQTGGRVFLFLYTDNLERDYHNLCRQKIKIVRQPQKETYGTVLVFEDLYGNLWDLIEPLKNIN